MLPSSVIHLLLYVLLFAFPRCSDSTAVVGYLPEWRFEGANWDFMMRTYTHLILFSLEVKPDGAIGALDRLPRSTLLDKAKSAAKKHSSALMICFGGNGRSEGFSAMVRSRKARAQFVKNLVALCLEHGFAGVDYNWEYPGFVFGRGYMPEEKIEEDYAGLAALLADTRMAFRASSFRPLAQRGIITLAYYPDGRQEEYLQRRFSAAVPPAVDSVDLMHAMAYDTHGYSSHSSLEYGRKCLDNALRLGLPASKTTLGLPFYGRFLREGDWQSYEDIVQRHHPLAPGTDVVPSRDGGRWGKWDTLAFNGVATIVEKTRYAVERGAGGVMVWEAGQDCRLEAVAHADRPGETHGVTCPGGERSYSLLVAIQNTLDDLSGNKTTSGTTTTTTGTTGTTSSGGTSGTTGSRTTRGVAGKKQDDAEL